MRSAAGLAVVAFACGVGWLQASAALPVFPLLLAIGGGSALVVTGFLRRRGALGVAGALGLAAIAAWTTGYGYAAWRAELRLADALPHEWEGEDLRVVGIVDELPASTARGTRFAFAVESASTPRAVVPSRLSLAWPAPWPGAAPAAEIPVVRAGERWELTVRLKRPHGNVNPGGFDLEGWLLQQGLRATGYVRGDASNIRRDAFAGRWRDHVLRARERVRARIVKALPGAPYAGVVVALAIGDQRSIPEPQWQTFNRTGITHLVSISGLHVTVFAAFAGGIAYWLTRRWARLTSRAPARKIAALAGVLAAGGYVLLAGAEIPALRTFAMLTVAAFGLWCGRPGTAGIVWLWALFAVLLWDPWAALTPGFWLSFGAVALLLYASAGRLREHGEESWRTRARTSLRDGAHAQWVITAGLTPATLALFQQMSLIAPLANAVAIPVVTLAIVPLALLGIFVPVDVFFVVAHSVLAVLMRMLEAFAAWPDATWQQHAPLVWTVVVGAIGTLWLLAPRGVPGRAWGALWLVPLFLVRPTPLPEGAFRMTVLDVGQGLAAVVETRQHTLVYDTGPRFTDAADAGNRIVVPFLRARGLRRVDGLIVSHQDLDHSGGAWSLLQATPVRWFASSMHANHPLVAHARDRASVLACVAGQRWTWNAVQFSVLHPGPSEYADPWVKTNDRSCVVRIDSAHGSALLAGDIEAKTETMLVQEKPLALRADLLLVPHHGSRTSSTFAFIRAVSPSMAVVASGYRNRFAHPRPDIVARYTGRGIAMVRTDQEGAVSFTFAEASTLKPRSARAERRRYWQDVPSEHVAPLD